MGGVSTWGLDEVRAWAQRPEHDGHALEHIRTVAVFHAQDNACAPEERRRWAKLALEVNARMPGDGPWELMRRMTNNTRLRTLIIDRVGAEQEDPDWDPDQVARDILEALWMTPDQAREGAIGWREQPIERIGELRRLKNISAPFEHLLAHLEGAFRERAQEWLEVRSELP